MSMTMRPIRGIGQVVMYLLIAQIVLVVAEAIALAHRIDVLQQLRSELRSVQAWVRRPTTAFR